LKAVDATLAETDHLVFDNAGTDNKMLVSVFRDQLAASETAKGTSELATDAEAVAGTDTTRHITPSQLGKLSVEIQQITRASSTSASFTQTLTHSL